MMIREICIKIRIEFIKVYIRKLKQIKIRKNFYKENSEKETWCLKNLHTTN